MSNFISFGNYAYNPTNCADKMSTIKYILQKEIDICSNLLKDLENQIPQIHEAIQLVTLLKSVKSGHDQMKASF